MLGTPVDWFHYALWLPIGTIVGWAVLYRTRPSVKADFAILGAIISGMTIFGLGLYADYWENEEKEKEQLNEQFHSIVDNYPELSNWRWATDGDGSDARVTEVWFEDPKGQDCHGTPDGSNIFDVTCRDIYEPPEESG